MQRNWTLLNGYIKYFCSHAIPGFNGLFSSKYGTTNTAGGSELDQILMEIFDYIRATNIYDSSLPAGNQFNGTALSGYGFGEVVPSYNASNDTKGFGRYPTISKAGVLFIASADPAHNQVISGSTPATLVFGPPVPAGHVRVQAALLFQLFDPAQGYTALVPDCQVKIVSSTMTWNIASAGQTTSNTSSPMFPSAAGALYLSGGTASQTVAWGGNLGLLPIINSYFQTSLYSWVPTSATQTSTAANPFPDFNTGGPIKFVGTVEAQVVTSSGNVVQDITFNFPADSIAMTPTYVPATPSWISGSTTYLEQLSNFNAINSVTGRLSANSNGTNNSYPNLWRFFVTSADIMQDVQSVSGDLRLIAAHQTIPSTSILFGSHPLYGQQFAHSFVDGYGMPLYGATRGQLAGNVTTYWSSANTPCALNSPFTVSTAGGSNDGLYVSQHTAVNTIQTCEPEGFGTAGTLPAGVTAGSTASWVSGKPMGDFDNGFGAVRDGPYINKADEGGLLAHANYIPYFMDLGEDYTAAGTAYFSPARQMPSAVMLGSLPTGVIDNRPWQTLLFRPDHTGLHVGNAGMGGNGSALSGAPGDYLLLDLFTMPVVEPYAISEPLSTAGRINMNYLIVPFTYINRDTGVRAVMESQQMLAVPNADSGTAGTANGSANTYKQMVASSHAPTFSSAPATLRYSINLDETLKGFAQRFYPRAFGDTSTPPDIFHSPAELCTLDLIPNDASDSNASYGTSAGVWSMQKYWESHQLTGDNSRERPYANIYPLLTTKSNTFTIHFRVQALQPAQTAGADPTMWREGTDQVTSEYRGSQTIERYVDPNVPLPDYASFADPTTATPLSSYYRFRVVSTRQFSP